MILSILYLCTFFVISLAGSLSKPKHAGGCAVIGQYCSGTFFKPCCGDTVCELTAPFKGTCVLCKSEKSFCWSDDECCSKECTWGSCRKVF
ncbi:hypothetical protein FBUS_02312 [Fasciolopsis buskii]|uniref:UPF0506 domain-containing protein n=1 Tax=Fasciolopsis buskii TaxID=27845 RepID=A0A8E0VGZ0_9TREM|nr:hypothetical protein FBUS_02312 [Fasciolopsis buski]